MKNEFLCVFYVVTMREVTVFMSLINAALSTGTQENYNSFPSRDLMMEKGKELECSRRAGGSGIREADSDEGSGNPSDF